MNILPHIYISCDDLPLKVWASGATPKGWTPDAYTSQVSRHWVNCKMPQLGVELENSRFIVSLGTLPYRWGTLGWGKLFTMILDNIIFYLNHILSVYNLNWIAISCTLGVCSLLPAFVPVHDPSRKAYIGIQNRGTVFTRRFESDHIGSQVPVKLMHLEGLYELFISKFVSTHHFISIFLCDVLLD